MIYSDEMIMKDLMLAFGEELQKRFSGSTQTIEEMMAEMKKQQRKISNHERRIALLENRLIKFMARPDSVSQGKKSKRRIAGSDISLIRTRLNLSQATFARLLKVDRASVCRWEHGQIKLSQKTMKRIAPYRYMGRKELAKRLQELEEEIWSN